MTLAAIIKKLRIDNPEPYAQTNGVSYKMEGDELEAYYAQAAQSILDQKAKELEVSNQVAAKASAIAKLEALGLNLEEAQAIFG